MPDGQVTFLDFGLVKRWTQGEWERLSPCLDAILDRDAERLLTRRWRTSASCRPTTASTPQVVFGYVSTPYRPYLTDAFTFTREFVADTVQRIIDVQRPARRGDRASSTCRPASSSSTGWCGGSLRSSASSRPTAPWRAILAEYREGAPPCTPLGEQDAAWHAALGPRPCDDALVNGSVERRAG